VATISDRITFTIPNMESDLDTKFQSNPNYANLKDNAVDRAKRELFGASIPPEGGMDERVKDWLADRAILYLLDVAEDYYKSLALADTVDEKTRTYYDKVEVVRSLRTTIGDRVEDERLNVADIISAALQPVVIPLVTSRGATKVTQNPFVKARPWRG
jgi:hypothetical protein